MKVGQAKVQERVTHFMTISSGKALVPIDQPITPAYVFSAQLNPKPESCRLQYNAAVSSVPASDKGHPALRKLRNLCNKKR